MSMIQTSQPDTECFLEKNLSVKKKTVVASSKLNIPLLIILVCNNTNTLPGHFKTIALSMQVGVIIK